MGIDFRLSQRAADCAKESKGTEGWAAHAQDGTAALLAALQSGDGGKGNGEGEGGGVDAALALATATNAAGHTNLMLSAKRGDGAAVEALLDAGANALAADGSRRTALHWALEYGTRKRINTCRKGWVGDHVRCVAALVRALAKAGVGKTEEGEGVGGAAGVDGGDITADAAPATLVEVLRMRSLEDSGEGWTPVQLAARWNNHLELSELLKQLRALQQHSSSGSRDEKTKDLLLAAVNGVVRGDSKNSALSIAASDGFKEVSVQLLEAGADVAAQSKNGMTPLHWCARGKRSRGTEHTAIVAYLLSFGAALEARAGAAGMTPLLTACQERNSDTVRVLLHHGADVHARTKPEGLSPLMLAASQCNAASVKALLAAGADAGERVARAHGGFSTWDIVNDAVHNKKEGAAALSLVMKEHADTQRRGGRTAAGGGSVLPSLDVVQLACLVVCAGLLAAALWHRKRGGANKARSM